MEDIFTYSSIVGLVAPFIMPTVFNLFGKLFSRELSKEEKRLLVTLIAGSVSVVIVGVGFDWKVLSVDEVIRFVMYVAGNTVVLKGTLQVVYEVLIKGVPELNKRF